MIRIYLDTRDLIILAERQSEEYLSAVRKWLDECKGYLVFSLSNILECCTPLSVPNGQSSVMRTLSKLETLPHVYLAEAKIHRDEIISAITSFSATEDYRSIDPYVDRFDQVLSPFQTPATSIHLKYGLAETVFDVWQAKPDLFSGDSKHSQILAASRQSDRGRPDFRRHNKNFPEYVRRTLIQFSISFPDKKITDLANWIWNSTTRCPSMRLGYEVYHQILRNISDAQAESDIGDLTHIGCIPYVDAITLDRRMRGYVNQADVAFKSRYNCKVFSNFDELQTQMS